MTKSSDLVDGYGRPIGNPQQQLPADPISPAIQALIETRLNGAADELRERNREELTRLAREQTTKWKWVTFAATLVSITSLFFIPLQVKQWLAKQVDTKITEPAIADSTDRVLKEKLPQLDDKLKPVEAKAEQLSQDVTQIRIGFDQKSKELSAEQQKIAARIRISELSTATKAGSLASYKELRQLAKDHPSDNYLAVSLKEIEYFYDADRAQIGHQIIVDAVTLKDPGFGPDEILAIIDVRKDLLAAGINSLAKLKSKGSVRFLCEHLQSSEDLHTTVRITRALEEITGARFRPLESDKALEWWAANKNLPIYNGTYDGYIKGLSGMLNLKTGKDFNELLEGFSKTANSDPDAFASKGFKAGLLLVKNQDKEAREVLASMEAKRGRWFLIWSAAERIKKGLNDEAITLVNEALEGQKASPYVLFTLRYWSIFQPIINDKRVKWPANSENWLTPTQPANPPSGS